MNILTKIKSSALMIFFVLMMTPVVAYSCPTGNPRSLAYIRRDNNRCEGIGDRNITRNLDLIAFSTGKLINYPDTLKIRVPGKRNSKPSLIVQSLSRNYLLDFVDLRYRSSGFIFNLKTKPVLQQANIPPESLNALAFINESSRKIYYPVILDQPSNNYSFVLYSPKSLAFPTIEIRRNSKVIPSNLKPLNIPRKGLIRLNWQYGNIPTGTYQLYVKDSNGRSLSFTFKHDKSWL